MIRRRGQPKDALVLFVVTKLDEQQKEAAERGISNSHLDTTCNTYAPRYLQRGVGPMASVNSNVDGKLESHDVLSASSLIQMRVSTIAKGLIDLKFG